jgi:hypothetical protein
MLRLSLALSCLLVPITSAQAADGIVIFRACNNHYVAETPTGYVLLQWYGGHDPMVGERISGEIEHYGMKDVMFRPDRPGRALVEDFWLNRATLASRLSRLCPGLTLPQ